MATRLSAVPERINAGTSVELTLGWSDYPADGGWALVLYFSGPVANSVTISGAEVVASGKMFDVTISAAKTATMGTAAMSTGTRLKWIARVTKSGVVKDADEGEIIVDPDPVTAGAYQSRAEMELVQCNTVITARLNGGLLESWAIGTRSGEYMPMKDLFALRSSLEAQAAAEKSRGKIQVGHFVFPGTGAER